MADNYKTDLANYKEDLVLSDRGFLFKKVQNGLLEEDKLKRMEKNNVSFVGKEIYRQQDVR